MGEYVAGPRINEVAVLCEFPFDVSEPTPAADDTRSAVSVTEKTGTETNNGEKTDAKAAKKLEARTPRKAGAESNADAKADRKIAKAEKKAAKSERPSSVTEFTAKDETNKKSSNRPGSDASSSNKDAAA